HPEPILVRKGMAPKAVTVGGMIMGVFDEALFEEAVVDLEPGDSLVLLTDGVIEAPGADGKRASFDRVLQTLDRPRGERARARAAGRMVEDMAGVGLKRA